MNESESLDMLNNDREQFKQPQFASDNDTSDTALTADCV